MFTCGVCDAEFYDKFRFESHVDRFNHWTECETCDSVFRLQSSCHQHMDALGHWATRYDCETCSAQFFDEDECDDHMDEYHHWEDPWECDTCSAQYQSFDDCENHMDYYSHRKPEFECDICSKGFGSQDAVDQHKAALGHYAHYCQSCERQFSNANALNMHLASRIHRGTNASCPFCSRSYASASGLASHLESGSCAGASKLNRESILQIVRQRDPKNLITKKQIAWHDQRETRYTATRAAYNDGWWECFKCQDEFSTKAGLEAHLNSPVHKGKIYHCPNTAVCAGEFVTIAGLFSHLESETCGFMSYNKVQAKVGDVLTGRRMISFK